jgi:hypothetical protein
MFEIGKSRQKGPLFPILDANASGIFRLESGSLEFRRLYIAFEFYI